MTDRDPFDDISHLDFDPEDTDLARSLEALDPGPIAAAAPPTDPREWTPPDVVDDDPDGWLLSDSDKELKQRLVWEQWRRGRRVRWAGAVVALALMAVAVSALLNRIVRDDVPVRDRTEQADNGPTSTEMASYLPDESAIRSVDPSLDLTAGNTGGAYDNLSFEDLDAGGPNSATFGAEAGVVQRWSSADGRMLTIGIYLLEDREAAEEAQTRALAVAQGADGAASDVRERFTVVDITTDRGTDEVATRVLSRFLVTFEALEGFDEATAGALLQVVARASAAVH